MQSKRQEAYSEISFLYHFTTLNPAQPCAMVCRSGTAMRSSRGSRPAGGPVREGQLPLRAGGSVATPCGRVSCRSVRESQLPLTSRSRRRSDFSPRAAADHPSGQISDRSWLIAELARIHETGGTCCTEPPAAAAAPASSCGSAQRRMAVVCSGHRQLLSRDSSQEGCLRSVQL